MAVLGVGGRLELLREAPESCVITPDDLNTTGGTIDLNCQGYWSGDHISIEGDNGLPIFIDGIPQCWDCVATYDQDVLFVAHNRDHIAGEDDDFYKIAGNPNDDYYRGNPAYVADDALFYWQGETPEDTDDGPGTTLDGYICIDALGRITLYDDRCSAMSCCGDRAEYSIEEGGATLEFEMIRVRPVENDWVVLCEIREYTLNLDAPSVDTTGVGEKWGNSVKSLVSGGGNVEFFVNRGCLGDGQADSMYLMQLLLMTQYGAKARAKFFLIQDDGDCSPCGDNGSLWYESDIYITQNAINVRPTDMLAGSAQFVTTGEIKLISAQGRPADVIYIKSEQFLDGGDIEFHCYYTDCDYQNDSPQLTWNNTSTSVRKWSLRVVDLDTGFVHWSVDGIPASVTSIDVNGSWPLNATINDTDYAPLPVNANGWGGPCPPEDERHTYEVSIEGFTAEDKLVASGSIFFFAGRTKLN